VTERYIFLTVNLLRRRSKLEERDFQPLALPIRRMSQKHGYLLTACRNQGRISSPRLRDHRGHGEEMQAKTVGQQTRNRDPVIPAGASRRTFLCGLLALCGEFFLRAAR
jgi:hypothetical protein